MTGTSCCPKLGTTAMLFCLKVSEVEGLLTVLICADCQAARGHCSGPYPVMTRAECGVSSTQTGSIMMGGRSG